MYCMWKNVSTYRDKNKFVCLQEKRYRQVQKKHIHFKSASHDGSTKGWMEQWWALLPMTDPMPSTGWMHIPC